MGCEGCPPPHHTTVFLENDICATDFPDCTRSSGRFGPSQLAARMFARPGRVVRKVLTFGSSAAHAAI